jgi:hypothetical protein
MISQFADGGEGRSALSPAPAGKHLHAQKRPKKVAPTAAASIGAARLGPLGLILDFVYLLSSAGRPCIE